MRTLAALLAMAAILAGCADDGPAGSEAPDGLTATDETGVVRGVVVDEAIRPMPDVRVRLLVAGAQPLETRSGQDGSFGFGDLAPGSYFLTGEKPGFRGAQTSVVVAAGISDPPPARLMLVADPASTPFVEVLKFSGYVECSTATPVLLVAVCSLPNIGPELACELAGQCAGNLTNDQFLARHETAGLAPQFVQSEMVWDSTQSLGNQFYVVPGTYDAEADTFRDVTEFEGPSPLVMPMPGGLFGAFEEGHQYQLRVFTGYAEETGGTMGMTVQQEFEIITHIFHNFTPPEGWTFTAAGPPPVPE